MAPGTGGLFLFLEVFVMSYTKIKNLVGRKFGRWTVTGMNEIRGHK
mgnify:FL=1